MLAIWLNGLLRRRLDLILGAAAGVALAVALLALLGAFLVTSGRSMTARSIAAVPVDWQIQLVGGADTKLVIDALGQATAYQKIQPVGYADATGFNAHTGGTVQTTGPGKVLGIDRSYRTEFPGQIRSLIGAVEGVLLAQQTAANLHATVGDSIAVERAGLPPVEVKVDGIVDLPNADSLFQAIGVPPGLAPQAPPDNVVILPLTQWHTLFDPLASMRPGAVQSQLHVGLAHDRLPAEPIGAHDSVSRAARNLEARLAGVGIVADNLGARLDAVRGDALYAGILFLFLGMPGALLAILLSHAVVVSGSGRRRWEQSLLRTRGASIAQILRLVALEAGTVGVTGVALGLCLAALAARLLWPDSHFTGVALPWIAAAALLGASASMAAVLLPAWTAARRLTVAGAAAAIAPSGQPLWRRFHVDLLLLLVSAALFWRMQRQGYQIVLAPEGVPAAAVDYYAFLAPTLLWIALALISGRLLGLMLGPARRLLSLALRPVAGQLSSLVAAALHRQRDRVTRAFTVVLLAMSFATSTAVFDATYRGQAKVDAELTNGADVTVTGSTAIPAGSLLPKLEALPGVAAAQSMQHRFAYVGSDLQDLYGIDPTSIGGATRLSGAYFQNGDAAATMAALAETPDGLLVSQETVQDYQLQPGDKINLRLLSVTDHQYRMVPFHLIGIVREFPTAPRDSFLVANAAYVAGQTGSSTAEVVLLRSRIDPARLAHEVEVALGPASGLRVSDIDSALRLVNSSLTAIDVSGLTDIELGFAALMLLGAAAIVFILNLAERRRAFAIMAAVGARQPQIRAFIWGEGLLVFLGGSLAGLLAGLLLAAMLVTLLTGVFDPPPTGLTIPWLYLAVLGAAMFAATLAAGVATQITLRRPIVTALREE
jgi:putative ABC transport system permease protein